MRRMGRRHTASALPASESVSASEPAAMQLRIQQLEHEVREVRTRINALFFAVIAAALGDLVGRLVLG